ncbi:MAG: response regulator [Proteobacteria bacterium]|nr:response regulator [Burkholderiales bacterium]
MAPTNSAILVVDDEPFNRDIITDFLEDEGYDLQTAEDGVEALAALNASDRFEAVLLDRMMPGLDGLEVLRRIKASPALRWLPIIMQTAAASRDQIVEGIEAGAFYYLTKPFEPEVLRSLVRSAVSAYRAHRSLRDEVEQSRILISLMHRASFSIRTPDEARRLAVLVANAAPVPDQAVMGLSELLINAIEHGNLGLTYEDKSRLRANGEWETEVERRLRVPEYAQRAVALDFRRIGRSIEVLITDEGDGFDWTRFLELDPARAFDTHGRGIALARKLSFETLDFLGKGNQVRGLFALREAA